MQNNPQDHSTPHQESPFKGKTGIRRLMNAFGYSMDGFKAAYQHEDAFRQEVWLSLFLIPLAFYLEAEALHRILMIGSVLLVMIVELLNSAVEAVVDRVSIERHALAKRAKDIGSAAVLLALINLATVWSLILLG
ncbi:diacylglycerol kinase [Methylophilus aquaticus]|uniref:Diacylglycerol kinase n=1 Tax=Methylophilus aquaticus TaxID=1971610 RepID=A0ABT9JUS5_9PROT|nr:diacylglycerol kinase [Methylophilus aquaticus]MDP8567881.1 diacylglycerol kinase [Methylophilus aquaticus]